MIVREGCSTVQATAVSVSCIDRMDMSHDYGFA